MSAHSDANPSPEQPAVHIVAAQTHGRVIVRIPNFGGPWPLLLGFHGYAQTAHDQLAALARISGTDRWLVASVQALHPFYTRDDRIVANWMTRLDREHAIADNIEYVGRTLDLLRTQYPTCAPLVFVGFSQGGAMAYRAAAHHRCAGVMVLASDVPPDVTVDVPYQLPPILIGRGTKDTWYTEEKQFADETRLRSLAATYETATFDGAHEWTDEFNKAAGQWLERRRRMS
jgi:predicted esterase